MYIQKFLKVKYEKIWKNKKNKFVMVFEVVF